MIEKEFEKIKDEPSLDTQQVEEDDITELIRILETEMALEEFEEATGEIFPGLY